MFFQVPFPTGTKYGMDLAWQANESKRKVLKDWILESRAEFAVPKTKILWVTKQFLWELEKNFDKTLFSLYVQEPKNFSKESLYKLWPIVLIVDEWDERVEKICKEWEDEEPKFKPLLVKELEWQREGRLTDAFILQLKNKLKSRIPNLVNTAKFVSRESRYSRCSFVLEVLLTAMGKGFLVFESRTPIDPGALVLAEGEMFQTPETKGLHLKIIESEYNDVQRIYRHTAEWFPITDDNLGSFPKFREVLRTAPR